MTMSYHTHQRNGQLSNPQIIFSPLATLGV